MFRRTPSFFNDDGLTTNNNQLTIQESTQRDQLKSAITELKFNPSNTATLPLTRRSQKLPYIGHISRIDLFRHGEISPKYLLTLIDPERSEIVNIEGIKTIFQLTQRESDIAQGVIEGKSNQEIADLQNITLETVKSHVKSITQKTHCNSRIEVIKLAHSTSIPIDSE